MTISIRPVDMTKLLGGKAKLIDNGEVETTVKLKARVATWKGSFPTSGDHGLSLKLVGSSSTVYVSSFLLLPITK